MDSARSNTEEEFLTAEEAATFLGVSIQDQDLGRYLQRYGIGRYFQPVPGRQIVYSRADIEFLKKSLAKASNQAAGR